MSEVWKTKNGPRKVRFDPPTLKEAIFAAQGLTGDLDQQAEIAAALMAVPVEDVRTTLAATVRAPDGAHIVTSVGRDGGARLVIVERKPNRHFIAGALRPTAAPPSASLGDRQGNPALIRRPLAPARKPVLV
jgi:hypothetical protein